MSTYTIRPGDSLSAIAARFHTSVHALAKLNHISNVNLIYSGHKLKIPDGFDAPKPPPPSGTGSHPSHPAGVHGFPALASASHRVADQLPGSGYCAKGVNMAIQKATGWRPYGNANELDSVLPHSGHFKQVSMSLEQALKIPGLVLTWEHSNNSAAGKRYGHTAITWGDGHTTSSDYIESHTTGYNRTGLKVFMYVG